MPINTPKQRQLQRERINRVKPWLKSTGPKTVAGKAIASMNSVRNKKTYFLIKEYERIMAQQKTFRKLIEEAIEYRIEKDAQN